MKRFVVSLVTALAALAWSSAPALAGGSDWHLGYYTPSGRALSLASADRTAGGLATFDFTNQPNTALLVTDQGSSSLLGDLTGKTVSATFEIAGAATFIYFGEPSCGTNTSTVRLFFQTSNAGGFDETHFWWSNPASAILANGTFTVTASVDGAQWSDSATSGTTQSSPPGLTPPPRTSRRSDCPSAAAASSRTVSAPPTAAVP